MKRRIKHKNYLIHLQNIKQNQKNEKRDYKLLNQKYKKNEKRDYKIQIEI